MLETLLDKSKHAFETRSFEEIANVLKERPKILDLVTEKVSKQIARTQKEESSPKNTTLYFNLLTETKDLIVAIMNLLQMYYAEYDSDMEPEGVKQYS